MSRTKRKGITIKIPVSQLEDESVADKVRKLLEANKGQAYTKSGILVEVFGFKTEDLNGSFGKWPDNAAKLYTKIGNALEELETKKLVESKKHGKPYFYFWKT